MSNRKPTPLQALSAASGLLAFACAGLGVLGLRWAWWGVMAGAAVWFVASPGALWGTLATLLALGLR